MIAVWVLQLPKLADGAVLRPLLAAVAADDLGVELAEPVAVGPVAVELVAVELVAEEPAADTAFELQLAAVAGEHAAAEFVAVAADSAAVGSS